MNEYRVCINEKDESENQKQKYDGGYENPLPEGKRLFYFMMIR